jgi:hypothetical protein
MGGAPQDRYEILRAWWFAPDCRGVLALARTPWGHRLLHFGLLGLLDQDPTGGAWFGMSSAAAGFSCRRLLLATDDGEVRARDAYRCLLELAAALEALEEVG